MRPTVAAFTTFLRLAHEVAVSRLGDSWRRSFRRLQVIRAPYLASSSSFRRDHLTVRVLHFDSACSGLGPVSPLTIPLWSSGWHPFSSGLRLIWVGGKSPPVSSASIFPAMLRSSGRPPLIAPVRLSDYFAGVEAVPPVPRSFPSARCLHTGLPPARDPVAFLPWLSSSPLCEWASFFFPAQRERYEARSRR